MGGHEFNTQHQKNKNKKDNPIPLSHGVAVFRSKELEVVERQKTHAPEEELKREGGGRERREREGVGRKKRLIER